MVNNLSMYLLTSQYAKFVNFFSLLIQNGVEYLALSSSMSGASRKCTLLLVLYFTLVVVYSWLS